ncbi:MAG: DUF503 domain-containing protein [Deltaproteobacteria bacterium]|nr:DUF503 domain-containing protein [Deltaproteobacteria bacterium]
MIVGICHLDVIIPENHSLKGKRQVIKKIIDRVRNRFNISIAEVGDNELWQRSQLGISLVGNDRRFVNSYLDRVINFIEAMNIVDIAHSELEIINF